MQKIFVSLLKNSLFAFFLLSFAGNLHAQYVLPKGEEISVSFKIISQKKEPVAFASVTAINRADSLQMDKKTADSSGIARFNLLKNGQYLIRITSVNHQSLEKGIIVLPNQNTFTFSLEALPKTLGGVVVRSSKPLMKQEDDKTIIDPDNLAAASTNAYEIIEKTPGLFVDQDGNIYISSLSPATVQINGRDMKMSTADMATLLKSLPPNSIDRIEIVRTPSAKYDASSTGGIVNVVLKKGIKIGKTGSLNAGIQQGTYGNRFAGITINNNDKGKSSSINLNYSRRNSYERIITDRLYDPDTLLSQDAFTKYPSDTYFGNYSLLFPLNKKWDIDFGSSISLNDYNNKTDNRSIIKKISAAQTTTDNLTKVGNDGSSLNFRSGTEAKLKLDSTGSEWSNDIFYNFTQNKADQLFSTDYYIPFVATTGGNGTSDNKRNLFTLTSDLKLKLKNRLTFETGMKSSFLNFKSITNYYIQSNGIHEKDPRRTNTFHYNENINALYIQGSKTLGKDIVIKAGTRLENTNMDGRQIIPFDTSFNIHRTDLFPYVYLSRSVMKIAGFELRAYLVYRRTIQRPVYEQLNPFPRYVDQYLTETGNPSLRPQFNQNYEANISVDERPILAIGVNDTKDIFTNVIYESDTSQRQAYRTYDNLGKNKEWYIRGLGAIPPGGRYFFVLGGQYNHNFYQGFYEKEPLSFKKGTWTFFTYHMFKIDKFSVITLNGFIRMKGQQQFYELSTFGALNTSINRKFLKEKLIVTLSMNDIFATNKNDFTIRQGSVDASGSRMGDTRRFGINLRYNFGMRKKEENNNMFNVESPEKTN
jgi:hypothetical protein